MRFRQGAEPSDARILASRSALLEAGHSVLKENFFSLLTEPALERLGPEYLR